MTSAMIPPIRQMHAASIRNCSRMVRRFAPMALRTPISRVRSATDTNMMFMMPMPPTNSDKPGDEQTDGARWFPRRDETFRGIDPAG